MRAIKVGIAGIVAALIVAAVFVACSGSSGNGSSNDGQASASATGLGFSLRTTPSSARRSTTANIPAQVAATLAKIDAGDWPPDDGSGTRGGTTFGNREGRLPSSDNGQRVRYREWDVNIKHRGETRDAERIITGSNGSAYYTLDHYQTFVRIR